MSLDEYRRKRDLAASREPDGGGRAHPGRRFVVQKHAARRLHYDFRLEVDGVLASWAVPRGPSMNPAEKRLAVRTEDHPLEYADFAGVIPKGNYGAGTVELWDRGTFDVPDTVPLAQQIERGKVVVALSGAVLHGRFVLIRTRRDLARSSGENWLLFKQRDEHADPAWQIELVEKARD